MEINELIKMSLISMMLAQILKIPFGIIINKKINFKVLFETGGMPSSHSSYMTALTIGIGRTEGFSSSIFALSFVISSIVMYDAMGVRREAGEHAKFLNLLLSLQNKKDFSNVQLKEFLGHTPFEVIGGFILGLIIGFVYPL